MLLFVLLAVFIGGLMVGPYPRVPGQEDPGARDQAGLARGPLHAAGGAGHRRRRHRRPRSADASIFAGVNPQGFSETLYAYLSQANNNGSAFAGYTGFVQPHAPGNVGAYGITFADLLGGAGDGRRPLHRRSSSSSPSPASLAGKKVAPAGLGHDAHRQPDLRLPADRRDHPRRRPHLLPRPPARPDRPEPDHEAVLNAQGPPHLAASRSSS